MEKVLERISIDNVIVTGVAGEYVFESIKKSQNFYEFNLLEKWTVHFADAKCIFDIGANLGNHTMYWSKNINAEKIYSFEPYKVNYEILCENIQNNALDNVRPIKQGVGATKGYTSIDIVDAGNLGATTLSKEVKAEGEIELIDIDSFCLEQGIDTVDFVKIDTEGYEENVLEGMKETIKAHHPDLWIEVGKETVVEVVNRLQEEGYLLKDVSGCNFLFLYGKRHRDTIEISNPEILELMLHNLERYQKYYSNYETAKKWHKNSLEKVEKLEKELADYQIASEEITRKLNIKQEECRLAEAKSKSSSETVENLKEVGRQRELLLTEYIAWNEQNKNRIFELETKISEQEIIIQNEKETSARKFLEEKNKYQSEKEEILSNLANERRTLEEKNMRIEELQKDIREETAQKEKCVQELQICLAELDEKKQLLEDIKVCKQENIEIKIKLEDEVVKCNKLKDELLVCVEELHEQERFLADLRQYIRKLETQNKYLASENAECRRKLSIITDTKLGKFCLKGYHLLKKIYRKIFRKK